jgi:hypothetical protein
MGSSRNSSLDDVIERLNREDSAEGDRFVDMRLDVEHEDRPGEILLTIGGRWDRRLEEYVAEAEGAVVIRIHDGQDPAIRWFCAWLAEHACRRDSPPIVTLDELEAEDLDVDPAHAYSALFAGGRRGGKTWIAVACAAIYALLFPRSIIWIVSPSDQKHDEVRRYMAGVLAATWIDHETLGGWEIVNGSQILLKSAYVADGLKEGKANLVVLNEGQMMTKRAYTVARGAIVDASGLVLTCANPPVEKKDQAWVSDFAADAAAGRRASVFVEFNPLLNPHIDRRALLAMKAELDERSFAIEVLGQFRGPADAVAYNWQRLENERAIDFHDGEYRAELAGVEYVDVTAQYLAHKEGPGIERLLGLDVQRFPWIGGPVYHLFAPAGDMPTDDNVIAWIVDEVVLDGGDEVDYCEEAREKGFGPMSSLIVCDASGRYQHSRRRSTDEPPPDWKGRGSFDIIRGEGFRRIVPPMRRMKINPAIVDRARAFTSMICSGVGRRRLFADPDRAPKVCASIRNWRQVHGTPSRTQDEAHLGDASSYPIVRLFPRMLRSSKPGQVDPVSKRVDNAAAVAANAPSRITPRSSGPSRGTNRRRGDRVRGL